MKEDTIYRPISLQSSIPRFLKIKYSRLYKHLCTNNILVKEQYGFRINSFTETVPSHHHHNHHISYHHHHHHHHTSFLELSHLLTRSGLTYPDVSTKVYHDSFCQLWSSISLPWVTYFEAFYLHVLSSFSYIPVNCPKLVLFFILTLIFYIFIFINGKWIYFKPFIYTIKSCNQISLKIF